MRDAIGGVRGVNVPLVRLKAVRGTTALEVNAPPVHYIKTQIQNVSNLFSVQTPSPHLYSGRECSYLLAIDAVAKRRHGGLTYNPQLLAPRSSAPTFHHPAVASHHRCPRQRTNQRADTRNNKNKDNKRQGQGERQRIYVMLAVEGG